MEKISEGNNLTADAAAWIADRLNAAPNVSTPVLEEYAPRLRALVPKHVWELVGSVPDDRKTLTDALVWFATQDIRFEEFKALTASLIVILEYMSREDK